MILLPPSGQLKELVMNERLNNQTPPINPEIHLPLRLRNSTVPSALLNGHNTSYPCINFPAIHAHLSSSTNPYHRAPSITTQVTFNTIRCIYQPHHRDDTLPFSTFSALLSLSRHKLRVPSSRYLFGFSPHSTPLSVSSP